MAASTPRFKRKRKINWTPYLFLIVPLLLYLVWIIGPMLYTFYLSLTDWDGISPEAEFIGLKILKPCLAVWEKESLQPLSIHWSTT